MAEKKAVLLQGNEACVQGAIRAGMRFDYGTRVGGVDLAEYLEQLGSQFGS